MSNRLANEKSPYLLEHKDNPVDWYPWCDEAFKRAKEEDKPVFLSIGYSACHWCHVLARESFEDTEIADILNKYFISVKVDKEERPDIDSVYMSVCEAFTGSGGWPMSIFMTADMKPFFAGTYFPKTSGRGIIGFRELLLAIHGEWVKDRQGLISQSESILARLNRKDTVMTDADITLTHKALELYERIYDESFGGFGRAPKFPAAHNILFLLEYHSRNKKSSALRMAEKTLLQMYRGGMFDHVGFGFCRYSTDKRFLVPHFEKMLYDNSLLILAYCKAYSVTNNSLYIEIAEKTAEYILREMTSEQGGFYSSQDADSEGEEGKYYLFSPDEITKLLGNDSGEKFNNHFDIKENGNFEGKNIPNLLKSNPENKSFDSLLPSVLEYRKTRMSLKRDEKILTSWNGLMIAALCELYLITKNDIYLSAAEKADLFIRENLMNGTDVFVSFYKGKRGVRGFLDDYAAYIFAQLALYRATLKEHYLDCAKSFTDKVISDFSDSVGGFYLYSKMHEELILRPKETYDGAIPSGNSLMAYNLVRLSLICDDKKYDDALKRQLDFISSDASRYPIGHAMFLLALLKYSEPPTKITISAGDSADKKELSLMFSPETEIRLFSSETKEYPIINGKTTYYICKNRSCLPPTNEPNKTF